MLMAFQGYESSEVQRVDSFITPGIKDSFSATNAKFCLSPTKIDGAVSRSKW